MGNSPNTDPLKIPTLSEFYNYKIYKIIYKQIVSNVIMNKYFIFQNIQSYNFYLMTFNILVYFLNI